MTEAAPAATAVVLRDAPGGLEALLLKRSSQLAFHGGAWVFPGGRIDAADAGPGGEEGAARRAAVREAREEAGLALDPGGLVQISHWTTPEGLPKRFATWFFVGRTEATQIRVDGGEIHAHAWLTPAAALAARARGEIELPPPTFVTLATLERFARADDALASARASAPRIFLPRVVRVAGGACSLYPADAGWEARDPERAGPRHRLVMLDSGWSYLRDV
ncbi:MAG TPA: NUDIX domain-containing protein [Myxococcota bacterium]|nr:NUDIX domain-containing protein [Myxococcota bacterium]